MQVFQTASPIRWQSFKWISRLVLFLFLLGIAVLLITFWRAYTPAMPRLISAREKQVLLDTTSSFVFNNSKIAKLYGGFRKFINEKEIYQQGKYPLPYKKKHWHKTTPLKVKDTTLTNQNKFPAGIRAAFYVDWDAQSITSLEKNITHLNLVIPEWLFIDPAYHGKKAKTYQ